MLNIKNKNHTHTIIVLIHTYRDYDEPVVKFCTRLVRFAPRSCTVVVDDPSPTLVYNM